ncbi:MAG: UrcA family protein [Cellvibrionaceae bacterium]|nr:UrcA family protein [Cellvibrionaceae bacterium]
MKSTTSNSTIKKLLTVSAIALSFGLASGVEAKINPNYKQEVVKFADLDLSKAEGQAVLQQRIERAAAKVCLKNERGYLLNLSEKAASNKCYRRATRQAKAEVTALKSK